jgi:hypothetical protein
MSDTGISIAEVEKIATSAQSSVHCFFCSELAIGVDADNRPTCGCYAEVATVMPQY